MTFLKVVYILAFHAVVMIADDWTIGKLKLSDKIRQIIEDNGNPNKPEKKDYYSYLRDALITINKDKSRNLILLNMMVINLAVIIGSIAFGFFVVDYVI